MKTIVAKRTGEFKLKATSCYKRVTVNFEIDGKNAEMEIVESFKDARLVDWHFVTGDAIIDSIAKIQSDFSAFEFLDIKVNIDEIIAEATSFFSSLKEEENAKKEELAKIERAEYYDSNFFFDELKPILEAKGYSATPSITKEDFVNCKGKIKLIVNVNKVDFHVYYNSNGYVEVSNMKTFDQDQRVTRSTRSSKLQKILELIEDVIETDKHIVEQIKRKNENMRNAKQTLEATLGIKVVCKKEWHSNNYSGRNKDGYYTEHYIDAKFEESGYYNCMRFEESSKSIDGKTVKGFKISQLPVITDMTKLKQIYELLTSL